MIATLKKNAFNKVSCEDNFFVKETDEFIYGGIFDGCSTGINSAWASQTMSYIFQQLHANMFLENFNFIRYVLEKVIFIFNLTENHLLSTCLLFRHNRIQKTLEIRCFGDGVYYVNKEEHIIDEDNLVNYIASNVHNILEYYQSHPIILHENVENFLICSDGIKSLQLPQIYENDVDAVKFLTKNIDNKTSLERKYNILKKKGWRFMDDITMIYYENTN